MLGNIFIHWKLEVVKTIIKQLELRLASFEFLCMEFIGIQSEIEFDHEEDIPLSEVGKLISEIICKSKIFC